MAIFNNSDLFANPFEKTKSVSGSKNVQNPFGDQKIPNYMELFQFNDATKPIDFVELKDDKSSDKKSSNSTELTMEEDVSVKDKLSWEKILGVEWKRGKDTSVTQKDGEKIFESTVKNVVSGEERKIKTVIHKDKETCSTYMSVNGTPEGNPYSKLIQELKDMGESATAETAETASAKESLNPKAQKFVKFLFDEDLAISENGKTRLKSPKIGNKNVEPTGDIEYYAGKDGNQYLQQSFKDKATGKIYRVTYQTAPNEEVSEVEKDINEIKKAETANSAAGTAGAPQNKDGNANVTEESETPVNNAAPDADSKKKQESAQNQQTLTEITYKARGNKYSVAINPLPSSLEENWTPGSEKEWIQLENNVWKHLEFDNNNNLIGRVFELVKTETGTDFKFLETYAPKNNNPANPDSSRTTEKVGDLQITYNAIPSGYDPNYEPGEGWNKIEYIQKIDGQDKKVVTYKNTENGLYFKVVPDKTNNTTKFIRDTKTLDTTGLKTPIKVTAQFDAPNIGPNYKYVDFEAKTDTATSGYGCSNIARILKYKRIDGEYFTVRFLFNNENFIWDGQAPQQITK